MISIITASINPVQLQNFLANVEETIGEPYESLVFDNRDNNEGICAIYNKGVAQAKFPILAFCHEDILFNTNNWGTELKQLLANMSIGIAGVAGATYKAASPMPWTAVPHRYYRINMAQKLANGQTEFHNQKDAGKFSEVVVLDGCFIAGRKYVFEELKWNDTYIPGFHLYDLDISLRAGSKYKIVVSNDINLTHFSEGTFDKTWLQASENYFTEFGQLMPISLCGLTRKEKKTLEFYAHYRYVLKKIELQSSSANILKEIIKGFYMSPFNRLNFSLLRQWAT